MIPLVRDQVCDRVSLVYSKIKFPDYFDFLVGILCWRRAKRKKQMFVGLKIHEISTLIKSWKNGLG